jgi:hypothetical protein
VIKLLAGYLRPLWSFPATNAAAQPADAEIGPDLAQAIAHFGTGRLRICADGVKGFDALLNAEPDSAYFFAFAEIALRCMQVDTAHSRFWFSLARTFTALQEPFTDVYADPACGRAHCAFKRSNRRDGVRTAEPSVVRDRLDYYRKRMPSRRFLPELEARFATSILSALYDEIVWPQTRCLDEEPAE